MTIRKFNSPLTAILASTAIVTAPIVLAPSAHALPVFDATNYSQNILQAARALQQIRNQITSIQNEAQSLLNDSRNLTKLPESIQKELDQSVRATQALLKEAKGIAYDVKNVDETFAKRYAGANLKASDKDLITQARERWGDSASGFQDALRVQAGIVQSMEMTRSKTGDLIKQSQDSVGALQASQAGNQLLALQLKQLTDLTALLAANGRAQVLDAANKASARAQAREQFKRLSLIHI